MAANGSRAEAPGLFEGPVKVAPGLTYLGSTRTVLSAQDLKHEPRWELPPGFSAPAAPKPGATPGAATKGKGRKTKKGGAKAAAALPEGGSQARRASGPAHQGKVPSNPSPLKNGAPKPDAPKSGDTKDAGQPASAPFSQPAIRAKKLTESEARELEKQAAATRIDYSKWAAIVDSDDEGSQGGGHDAGEGSDDEVDEYGWVYDEDKACNMWSPTGKKIKRSEAVKRGERRMNQLMPSFGSDEFYEHFLEWSKSAAGKAVLGRQEPVSDGEHDEERDAEGQAKPGQASGRSGAEGGAGAKGRPIDYSKWDALVDSDEERERAAAQGGGCCRHCKCCYPDGSDSDGDECSDGEGHSHRYRQVHTVPGRKRDDAPEGHSGAGSKVRGGGTQATGARGAGEAPPSADPRAGHSGSKHENEGAAESKDGESAAKKPGLRGGFFAPKAAAKPTEGAPDGSGKEAGDAGPQKPSVDDLRIYHKLGGTAKPLTAYPLKTPEEQKNWRTYIHSDGRLYFVRAGSSGQGTWWKPDELLDVSEATTGWQELYDKTGRVYYYCPSSGCLQDEVPVNLEMARQLLDGPDDSGLCIELMPKAVWQDLCKLARGAATPEEAADRAVAAMVSMRFFPPDVSTPGLHAAIRARMETNWPLSDEEGEPPGPRCPVGKLTDFPPKFPETHHRWRSYRAAKGRFYFVRDDDPGPGTWYRPEDLLDIPEYITGWQEILGSGPGSTSYYHYAEVRSQVAVPLVLAKARLLQEHCPFLTPHLAAQSFPAFLKHMEQATTEEHAERLAAEALAKYLNVPASVRSPSSQPQPPSGGSQADGTQRKEAAHGSTAAAKAPPPKQGGTAGARFSVENVQLTRYRRMQPQKYHDWQAYKHADGRLYFVREGDPGPGTWRKPYDLQDATEGLAGWQELVGADGRAYYWHDGQQRRAEALPEELRQARDLVDREAGGYGPMPDPAEVLDLMLTAKSPEEVMEGIMRGALTSGMRPEDRAVMERLVAAKLTEKWPDIAGARPETTTARDKPTGASTKPSGADTAAAARSGNTNGQGNGKSGQAGSRALSSRRESDGTQEPAVTGAAEAKAATSSRTEVGAAGRAQLDDEGPLRDGGGGDSGDRVGLGGERVKVCWSCGKDETAAGKFKKCDACARARYCSRDCQRNHWKSHKDVCREWAAERLKRKLAGNIG